jgi:hypothetical protein
VGEEEEERRLREEKWRGRGSRIEVVKIVIGR